MTENSQDPDSPRVALLRDQVRDLAEDAAARAAAKRTRQKVTGTVGVTAALFCLFGLSAVTRMGRQLDTDAVAELGRAELQGRMPASREALEEYLQQEAPRLVGETLHSLVELIPQGRVLLTQGLTEQLALLNREFENEFVTVIEHTVNITKERLDAMEPDLSDREKLERLVAAVTREFNANFEVATDALYPAYHAELETVRAELVALQQADPEELSDAQRIKREIIETMLQLILRERAGRS